MATDANVRPSSVRRARSRLPTSSTSDTEYFYQNTLATPVLLMEHYPMVLALHDHDFRRVWAAQSISSVGDWFLVLAIPVHVYALTGSPLATGLVYAAQNLPAIVVGPFA